MKRFSAWVLALALGVTANQAQGWEAPTTHAGITEQSALKSGLHDRLRRDFGVSDGLFGPLIVPPKDAPPLFSLLRRLNPTHGYVPDRRGRMGALGWLMAGTVIADSPARFAANHFLDPKTGKGLSKSTLGRTRGAFHKLAARRFGEQIRLGGMPADQWIEHGENPMGWLGFADQYKKAVSAKTPAERERHLAGTLLAAGAMLHVLQDMGSPSHVRNDLRAHLDRVGDHPADTGSRLERIAAISYGRLGVPAPKKIVHRDSLRDFFRGDDGQGLASVTAARWYSPYTLPAPVRLSQNPTTPEILRKAKSAFPGRNVALVAAKRGRPGRVLDAQGMCLTAFAPDGRELEFFFDDACMVTHVGTLVRNSASYSSGLLAWLFRGSLKVSAADQTIAITSAEDLAEGTLSVMWDDSRGVRKGYHDISVRATSKSFSIPPAPAGASRISALFVGKDKNGQPLLATGTLSLVAATTK